MDTSSIFQKLDLIKPQEQNLNKYAFWGFNYADNYRIINMGTIMREKLEEEVPEHIIKFVNEQGLVVWIDNKNGAILRSVRDKRFMVVGKPIFYGLSKIKNFTYGNPVVLVEGAIDRDVLSKIFPNVLAVLTSGLSKLQMEVLKNLTDSVILAYDNDEVGNRSKRQEFYKLRDLGFKVKRMEWEGYKDFGDLADMLMVGNTYEARARLKFLKAQLEVLTR